MKYPDRRNTHGKGRPAPGSRPLAPAPLHPVVQAVSVLGGFSGLAFLVPFKPKNAIELFKSVHLDPDLDHFQRQCPSIPSLAACIVILREGVFSPPHVRPSGCNPTLSCLFCLHLLAGFDSCHLRPNLEVRSYKKV